MAIVHLSFDNGPNRVGTPRVLEVLARRGLKATFFALGRCLEEPEGEALAREVLQAGHLLGNHTFHHEVPLGQLRAEDGVEELARTHAALQRVGGSRIFRPYGGGGAKGPHLMSAAAADWLGREAYTVVLWDAVPGDFRDPVGFVETAVTQCRGKEEVTMVLHDARAEAMLRLDDLIERLADEGHRLESGWSAEAEIMRDGRPSASFSRYVSDGSRELETV